MRSKFSPLARMVALGLCAGALGSFAMAAPAMAAAPAGTACQASDGKISGRGSTLQGNALTALIGGYTTQVCGSVGNAGNLNSAITTGDPAGSNMIVYNWSSTTTPNLSPTTAGARGSGEGLASQACRTDMFGGTDIPNNNGSGQALPPATGGTLPWLWSEVPHTTGPFSVNDGSEWAYYDPAFGPDGGNGCDSFYGNGSNGSGNQTAWLPPYTPPNAGCTSTGSPNTCYPSTAGGATNATSPLMTFPIALASAGLGVNFKPGGVQISGCPTTASQVQLTSLQVSKIFSGDITNWDTLGNESSFNWTGCNEAITRIVRGDISGTTQEMKTYLRSVDGSRTLCSSNTWTTLAQYNDNTFWPGDSNDPCSGVTAPTTAFGTGGGASCPTSFNATKGVICALAVTGGGITYGDLSNWKSTANVIYAEVVPVSGTTGVLPGTSATLGTGTPNCDTSFSGNTPGAGGPTDFVGLDDTGSSPDLPSSTNWGTDGANGSAGTTPPSDVTNIPGSLKWPICTLTYDMVYAGLSGSNSTYPNNAFGVMTADQRRTLYTFFAFVLAPDGQNLLKAAGYLPLPSLWAFNERSGFESGF